MMLTVRVMGMMGLYKERGKRIESQMGIWREIPTLSIAQPHHPTSVVAVQRRVMEKSQLSKGKVGNTPSAPPSAATDSDGEGSPSTAWLTQVVLPVKFFESKPSCGIIRINDSGLLGRLFLAHQNSTRDIHKKRGYLFLYTPSAIQCACERWTSHWMLNTRGLLKWGDMTGE